MAETARALAAAALSHPGRVRTNNEDLPVLDPERGIFGVIDGVGGHAGGETAAAIAHDVILQRLGRPLGTAADRVREAIAIANNEIFRRAEMRPDLAGMTCVVTLAVVVDGRITVGHVGDSRLYKMRPSGLVKLTHDHSPVGEREDAREITEAEAMQHPRRHEVFRDVGSALRDKDEPDYVEVIDDTLEDDAALIACSDGLTDMVPAATLERVVRAHAGDPHAVVAALVAAANEAGGRDNVTVVYAEAPGFAAAVRGTPAAAASNATPGGGAGRAALAGLGRSRPLWFAAGACVGVLAALLIAWRLSLDDGVAGRTIVAAPQASETVGTLGAAVQEARAGDVIRLEPGTYAESLVVPDGVSLRARVPGASVFVRPPSAAGDWIAVSAGGERGGAISGLRILSTAEAPVEIGVRVSGHGRALELLHVEGPVRAAVEFMPDSTASLLGSHFAVAGGALSLAPRSQVDAAGNVFVRETTGTAPEAPASPPRPSTARSGTGRPAAVPAPPQPAAISVAAGADVTLRRNVFAGFGTMPVAGLDAAAWEPLRAVNVIVTADRLPTRRLAGDR